MELKDTNSIQVLSLYLPQYYPFKENNEWWGKGFTEWTNVGKAKPLFRGHYQPKIPADLGYYDLRVPEVAEEQANLAREAGVAGFMYWHYWFGNGRTLLDMATQRMIQTHKPDFPFCFAWANHNWYSKSWSPNGSDKLLIEQKYPGEKDNEDHFYYCLKAFKDDRYIRYNNQPVFMVFNLTVIPNVDKFIDQWNTLIRKEGIADKFFFIANIFDDSQIDAMLEKGFDAVSLNIDSHKKRKRILYNRYKDYILRHLFSDHLFGPRKIDYNRIIKNIWHDGINDREEVITSIIPNWDHTPRSGKAGSVYVNATPENFGRMVKKVSEQVNKKKNKIIILKSWNEWGEGNYMEPDLKYGKGFIHALAKNVK